MHDLGFVPAEHLGQRDASLERVEQPAVGHVEVDPPRGPQDLAGPLRLGEPNLRSRRVRGRLAIGQVDDPHGVTASSQASQRPPAGDFDVVGVGAHRDQVELRLRRLRHATYYLANLRSSISDRSNIARQFRFFISYDYRPDDKLNHLIRLAWSPPGGRSARSTRTAAGPSARSRARSTRSRRAPRRPGL